MDIKDIITLNYVHVRNPWVELILENQLVKGGCLRVYKHMVKLIHNSCGTLGS